MLLERKEGFPPAWKATFFIFLQTRVSLYELALVGRLRRAELRGDPLQEQAGVIRMAECTETQGAHSCAH